MKTVLVLTASFGDGHNAAARNICDALESVCNEVRVEAFDIFETSSGRLETAARKAYRGLVQFAPTLWSGLSSILDRPTLTDGRYFKSGRLQRTLGHLLQEIQPDVVVSTYPLYAKMIGDLYRDHAERPFRLVTVVTDNTADSAAWSQGPSDVYCVPNESSAALLRSHGITAEQVFAFGFPVSPLFCELPDTAPPDPGEHGPYRVLYLIAEGQKKALKGLRRLLEREQYHLTVVVGRNAYLKARLTKELKPYGQRAQVLGWTNQMPYLMRTHHLVVARAGAAVIHEAMAAQCPFIGNQVSSAATAGVTQLLVDNDIGAVATKPRALAQWVKQAFKRNGKTWRRWRENLVQLGRPAAALRIAELVLQECESPASAVGSGARVVTNPDTVPATACNAAAVHHPRPLLCDFHIHSNYSDGKLSVSEVIDFYGRRHFDCICLTDHLADSRRLIGKLGKLSRLTLSPSQLTEYFEVIERERRRAWRKYSMLVMTGLEFNKDGLTQKSSAHLLGIDLEMPIIDCLDLPETIAQIHAQGGLAVASHPHIMKSEWGKNTLYLWEHQERFAPLLDAWEIANRNNMFNPVSAKRLPYLANSDFHKPRHIYSWKTLVSCEKNPAAIKECIRKNERIAITLYRENDLADQVSVAGQAPVDAEAGAVSDGIRQISPLLPAA